MFSNPCTFRAMYSIAYTNIWKLDSDHRQDQHHPFFVKPTCSRAHNLFHKGDILCILPVGLIITLKEQQWH